MSAEKEARLTQVPPYAVIVLGGSFPALGIVQSLGLRDIECWVCAPVRAIATRSRYARYCYVPDPADDSDGMVAKLLELLDRMTAKPILIPADDQYAQTIARNRHLLQQKATLCVADSKVVDLLIDKRRFTSWAAELGLSSPSASAASHFRPGETLRFPVVARSIEHGRSLNFPNASLPTLRFALIRTLEEWEVFRKTYDDSLSNLIVQEFVPGNTADMFSIGTYIDRQSRIKGVFVGRKIRGYPAMFGDARAGQNDVVPEWVLEEVRFIAKELKYSGIAEFEYKRDCLSGQFRLIEVNPRSWSWIAATIASPADIPWIAYQDLSDGKPSETTYNRSPGSIRYVRLLWDFVGVTFLYRSDYPDWTMTPMQWWKSLSADRLVIAEFGRRDWPLAFWSIVQFITMSTGSLYRRTIRKVASRESANR